MKTKPPFASALLCLILLASCGGGGHGSDNAAQAPDSSGRAHALAVKTSLAISLPQDPDPVLDGLSGIPADAATRGMWSGVQPWPMNAIHAALLPNGKVLTYGAPANTDAQDGRTFDVWTPTLGFTAGSHLTSFDAGRVNSFCSTTGYLNDGRLLITGGNSPRGSQFYTPVTQAAANDGFALADDRWYATMLSLPDGRMVMLGGMDPYQEAMANTPDQAIQNGYVSMTPEIYTVGTGWRSLTGATSRDAFGPDYLRTSYPRAWVAPNGLVFGISSDNMWFLDVNANSGTGAITLAGKFKTPYSANTPVNAGATSTAVMFAPGRILQVGGNGGFNGDGLPASNAATIVDINGANPVLTETAAMAYARRFPNAAVLPNGQVLVTGGTKVGNNGGADAVYASEIWNPATGQWTLGASAGVIRVYHSVTMLMPNGTLLSMGGGTPGPVYNQNAEVYYPPYLFTSSGGSAKLATRPAFSGISAMGFTHGGTGQVELASTVNISRMVLIGTSTTTHLFNTGQRFVELAFTQSGDRLSFTLPASVNTAPPGYYQLFALDANGVPSKAVIVSLGQNQTPPPVPTPALVRGQTYVFGALSQTGMAVGTDANNLGVLLAAPSGSTAPQNAQFVVRDGLADASCISLESVAQPGRWLRHYAYRTQLGTSDGSDLFKADATFCPEAGLGGSGLTLRSKNFPDHVLHHRNGEVWIDTQATDATFAQDASFSATPALNLPFIGGQNAAPLLTGGTASYAPGLDASGLSFSWNFGDGSAATPYSATSAITHAFTRPGLFQVTLTVLASDGRSETKTFTQAVTPAATTNAPRASSPLLLEPRTGASTRLWVVNPDNDSVSVFDTATNAKVAEITVGTAPRTLARASDGRIWVANRDSATLSLINAGTLAVASTVQLPRASQPWGLVIAADGNAYVSLQASGQVLKLNGSTGATLATLAVGANPRHLSVSGDSARLLVSRFITAPLPGEGMAVIDTSSAGAEVLAINTATMTLQGTVVLKHSDKTDTEVQGAGIPNYLAAAVISPDGKSAWVPGKQDNIKRGTLRNGLPLNFQNTVRAISSRIELPTLTETLASRADHDNAGLASAAAFDVSGAYLFVALETSRQVEVINAFTGAPLFRIEAGLAPQGVTVSADNTRLYVHNFMARNVGVVDISPLTKNGEARSTAVATLASVATEKLPANVLLGKQLFHDARDPRLARDSYLSCATCHNEAGHDGRTWDFTGFGEGLRNTVALKGRAGTAQGFMHWSANFDEVQDFEGQIRNFAGGTGLMSDAQFNTGTRSQPLGDAKAGVSADLDALAGYLGSLNGFATSPFRNADGTLTSAALAGKAVFTKANCASCHGGSAFTLSANGAALKDVGTIKSSSGKRLGGTLTGIDIPTLRDAWAGAPYLHDGSAATLQAAVQAHTSVTVAQADLPNLVAYLQQIGGEEPGAIGTWSFNEGIGTTAADRSGLNHPITLSNASWTAAGKAGNALQFNGTNASGSTAVPIVDTRGSFSVSAWVRLDSLTGWRTAVNQDGVNVSGFWLQYSQALGTKFALTLHDVDSTASTAYRAISTTTPTTGVWYHLVGVRDKTAGTLKLYVNGQLQATTAYTGGWAANGALNVGRGKWSAPNDWFGGSIDEVQVFGSALSDADAAQLYTTGLNLNQAPTVAISSPAANASFTKGVTITLAAGAADADGTVSKVDWYDGSTLIGSASAAPYTLKWSGAATGTHTLTARATDNNGAVTPSAAVAIKVVAPTNSPLFGSSSAGTAFTDGVANDQVLTGVSLRASTRVDALQGLATPANLASHGGTGGTLVTASWPAGETLVRIYGKTGSSGSVAQISFVTSNGKVYGPYGTAQSQGTLTNFDYTVPAGNRVLGFTGRSGSSLNAIGVVYGP